jgi:hypothetical protein
VLGPNFVEHKAKRVKRSPGSRTPLHQITEHVDPDVYHNILYYLYTFRVTFTTDLSVECAEPSTPKLCSAEDIYALADKMLLQSLKDKALDFLKETCTVENIISRLFSKFARSHADVEAVYMAYFMSQWAEVKNHPSYTEYKKQLEEASRESHQNGVESYACDLNSLLKGFENAEVTMQEKKS